MACHTRIKPWDLVPVASFLVLGGRCRYCGTKLSWQYPLVELATGSLYVTALWKWGVGWETLAMLVFFSMLLVVTVIDLYHQIIPNRVLLVSGVLGLPLIYLQSLEILKTGTIGFFVAGALLFIIALVSKGGMGGGDIKLAAVMGMFLGLKLVMVALFLAFLIGGIIGIILLATGQRGRKDPIPFGPFLALGSLIAALVGEKIISWYTGFW
ncbi:hypothetical protein N752_13280 [Desulforamulus aquiferis]|nr:hypothetical protein N752_13280 [Desulforamulus aquiferis]